MQLCQTPSPSDTVCKVHSWERTLEAMSGRPSSRSSSMHALLMSVRSRLSPCSKMRHLRLRVAQYRNRLKGDGARRAAVLFTLQTR